MWPVIKSQVGIKGETRTAGDFSGDSDEDVGDWVICDLHSVSQSLLSPGGLCQCLANTDVGCFALQ